MEARRSLRVAVVALVALVGLAACSSPPSAKRVALDVVQTLDVSDEVKACMTDKIENEYTEDEIQAIGDAAEAGDTDSLDQFQADLEACNA